MPSHDSTAARLVRIGVPAAILVAGLILIGVGGTVGGEALGLALILVAGVVMFANGLLRFGLRDSDDRAAEEDARRRFRETGRWD